MKQTYRGYEIQRDHARGWLVSLNGDFLCAQPSEEFAYKWVDEQKKAARAAATQGK